MVIQLQQEVIKTQVAARVQIAAAAVQVSNLSTAEVRKDTHFK